MLVIENCNSLSELRQKLIDGEEVRTARNDLCEEAISRAKALEAIKKLPHAGWLVSTESVLNVLSELPPVTPLEQELCEDWHDVPSDEMTLEQARQAVKDLRKKLTEYLEQEPCEDVPEINVGDIISRQAVLDKKELVELEDGQSFYCISPEDVETLPSVNPQYTEVEGQKSEDAISRQAAIEIARSNIHYGLDKEYEYARELLQKTMAEINSLPPVNPQPKTGHWVYRIYGEFHEQGDWYCSKCDYPFNYGYGHAEYCPKCGCKMSETPTEEVIGDRDYDWVIKR